MAERSWEFTAALWRFRDGSWHFVTVPEDVSDDIADLAEGRAGGFGSVRVEVRCGTSTWRTSLFPSREAAAYVLPVKSEVRKANGLSEGDAATYAVTVLGL